MAEPPRPLTAERVKALRRAFADKFAGDRTVGQAVDSILEDLDDGWDEHPQGMGVESFEAVTQALGPALDALEALPAGDAKAAAERLVDAWAKCPPIDWT